MLSFNCIYNYILIIICYQISLLYYYIILNYNMIIMLEWEFSLDSQRKE